MDQKKTKDPAGKNLENSKPCFKKLENSKTCFNTAKLSNVHLFCLFVSLRNIILRLDSEFELDLVWEKLETLGEPLYRYGHTMTAVGKLLYLFGGDNLGIHGFQNDVWTLNTGMQLSELFPELEPQRYTL
jgi:hypothetical protein